MLEPEWLSVREGCEVYRRWWRTEEAFLRPKRLFGFKLEAGDCNGVESHSTPHGGVIPFLRRNKSFSSIQKG
jgi:hypothetical protein